MPAAPQIKRGASVEHNWPGTLTRFGTGFTGTAAAATAVVITLDANPTRGNILRQIICSYTAAPTGGRLTVEDGSGTIVFDVDIAAGGPTTIHFDPPLCGSTATDMIITLASGAGAVVGKLNVSAWTEE